MDWASRHGMELSLNGTCGFNRPCVGVVVHGTYPRYESGVWKPADAYHKYPCVAVLGHGKKSEEQLYAWLTWFDNHGYTVVIRARSGARHEDLATRVLHGTHTVKMQKIDKGTVERFICLGCDKVLRAGKDKAYFLLRDGKVALYCTKKCLLKGPK